MMGVGLRSSGDRGHCVQTPESPGTCCGRADGEAQPLKVEVQGQASEAVLPEEMQAALGEEDRKREVGLEGSWPREEGGWWSGVNPWTRKRSREPEGLRTQAEGREGFWFLPFFHFFFCGIKKNSLPHECAAPSPAPREGGKERWMIARHTHSSPPTSLSAGDFVGAS